jgi:metal-responsive CopG/Arc/MetJ family transcriptional regulator
MMRLSISVDPELLEEVRRLAKVRTKREAIERALQAFVRQHRLQELQALVSSGVVEMDLEERGTHGGTGVYLLGGHGGTPHRRTG